MSANPGRLYTSKNLFGRGIIAAAVSALYPQNTEDRKNRSLHVENTFSRENPKKIKEEKINRVMINAT